MTLDLWKIHWVRIFMWHKNYQKKKKSNGIHCTLWTRFQANYNLHNYASNRHRTSQTSLCSRNWHTIFAIFKSATPLSEIGTSYICYDQMTLHPKKTISRNFMYNWDILMLKCCIEIDSLAYTQPGRGAMHPSYDLGLTAGNLNISVIKLRVMLRFQGI